MLTCDSGTWSTYLGIYFSVRARALSSLISPFLCIIGCFGLGFVLDLKGVSQRRRAQYGLFTVIILNLGVYIWSIVMQNNFVQTTGPLSQSYMYWLLSSFATDAQGKLSPRHTKDTKNNME
jgi:UDP-N-acetylmuramyl pentapeptide phosphotransferase/UDP-N-acetylglucosamine-1-phosphate transferase